MKNNNLLLVRKIYSDICPWMFREHYGKYTLIHSVKVVRSTNEADSIEDNLRQRKGMLSVLIGNEPCSQFFVF